MNMLEENYKNNSIFLKRVQNIFFSYKKKTESWGSKTSRPWLVLFTKQSYLNTNDNITKIPLSFQIHRKNYEVKYSLNDILYLW